MRKNNVKAEKRFDFFMADKSEGLKQAGMARLNQSIEAFVYCIVGAQVIVRSSWVHQEALTKPNASSSYWLRVLSESQTF